MATDITTKRPWALPRVTTADPGDVLIIDREGGTVRSILVSDLGGGGGTDPGALQKASNLSDLANAGAARTNLGLATVAASGAYGDLSGKPTLGGAAALNVGTTAGTVAAGDDARFTSNSASSLQNAVLGRARIAKALGSAQSFVDSLVDGFAATDGLNLGASSGYTLDTTNRRIGPTVTAAIASAQIAQATGTVIGDATQAANAFDGNTATTSGNGAFKNPGTSLYVGKNYGTSPQKINSAQVYPSTDIGWSNGAGTTVLNLRGSNTAPASASNGTLLGTLGVTNSSTAMATVTSTDTVNAYQYVWIELTDTVSGVMAVAEIRFFNPAVPATTSNMTLVAAASASDFVPSTIQVSLDLEPIDSITLGTDLTAEVSRDGGTTWTAAALTQIATLGARRLAQTADISVTGQPSGSSVSARIKTLTGKKLYLHGQAISWKA